MTSAWMVMASHFESLGLHERPGPANDPRISEMYRLVNGTAQPDSVPWCAAFVGACLELSGYANTSSLLASSYKTFGEKLSNPIDGCIVVLKPQAAGASGHVGFFVSQRNGRVTLLAGNQSDAVKESSFDEDDIVALRWPVKTAPLPASTSLPTILDIDPASAPPHVAAQAGALWTASPPAILMQMGSSGSDVASLQDQLGKLNYHLGASDGEFGPLTRAAVLAFQADAGLPVTGVVTAEDKDKLAAWIAANLSRPIGKERSAAKLDKLRDTGSRTVSTADWLKRIGIGTGILGGIGFTDKQSDFVPAVAGRLKQALGAAPSNSQIGDYMAKIKTIIDTTLLSDLKAAKVSDQLAHELTDKVYKLAQKTVDTLPYTDANAVPGKLFTLQSDIIAILKQGLPTNVSNLPKLTFDVVDKLIPELGKPIMAAQPPPVAGVAQSGTGVMGPLIDLIPALIGGNGSATWLLVALGGYLAYRNGGKINDLRLEDYRDAANQKR